MRTTLEDITHRVQLRHLLSDEAREDIRREMASYAVFATIDSEIRNEAMQEYSKIRRKQSEEFRKQYAKAHALCPECGAKPHSSTYAGYILDMSKPETYRDENKTVCSGCGHSCTTHERISEFDWKWKVWEMNKKAK